jgi:hypothetical protein
MREIRPSGSEGGARFKPLHLPYPVPWLAVEWIKPHNSRRNEPLESL